MVQGDYQPTNYTTKSRTHWSMLNSRRLFPTSLCGVLFFGSVSRPCRLLLLCAPFATHNFVTYTLSHTTLSRTIFHTHTHLLRTVVTNSAVECIGRAQHQPLNDRMNVHWTHTHIYIYIYICSAPPQRPPSTRHLLHYAWLVSAQNHVEVTNESTLPQQHHFCQAEVLCCCENCLYAPIANRKIFALETFLLTFFKKFWKPCRRSKCDDPGSSLELKWLSWSWTDAWMTDRSRQ